MLAFYIYLIGFVDAVQTVAVVFLIFLFLGTIAAVIFYIVAFLEFNDSSDNHYYAEEQKKFSCARSVLRSCVSALVVSILVVCFTPSSKTVGAMYVIPAIVNNERIQNITGNGLEVLEKLTKEWVESFSDKKKGDKEKSL